MTPYVQLATDSPKELLRTVGLSQADFHHLNDNLAAIDTQKALPPDKTRTKRHPVAPGKALAADALYDLRHYPTLINPGAIFGISESYCHKIYTRTARLLAKVEKLPNRKALLQELATTWVIDVSEHPIERPVKDQKAYYSGKNVTRLKPCS